MTDQADSLAEVIESHALPVLRTLTTLEEIEAALREWSFADVRRRKLPAVLILLNRPEEARAVVQTELDDLRATSDPTAMAEYEQAAARLFNDQRDA